MLVLSTLVGCTGDGARSPSSSSTSSSAPATPAPTSSPRPVVVTDARYSCAPSDGPWVELTVTSPARASVIAEALFRDHVYGRSKIEDVLPDAPLAVGFDPQLPREIYGTAGTIRIAEVDDGQIGRVLATAALPQPVNLPACG